MAEADRSILQRAVITEARRQARKAVKRQSQARGLKPNVIGRAADEYLREHRELIAEAANVERIRAEGAFGKRLAAIQNPLEKRAEIGSEIREGSIAQSPIQ